MGIHSILVAWLLSAVSTFAAVTLIDSQTRNGSFEDGVASPWSNDAAVVQDAAFASHGNYYVRCLAQGLGLGGTIARTGPFQRFQAQKSDGLSFVLTFDARNAAVGFYNLHVELFAKNAGGTIIGTGNPPVVLSNLNSSAWVTHQFAFELSDSWDGIGNVSLNFLFYRTNAVSNTVYTSYLDNITLRQLTEPRLEIAFASSSQVGLSWRTNAVGFVLESRSMAAPGAWFPVPETPAVVGQKFTVTVSALETSRVFRLRK